MGNLLHIVARPFKWGWTCLRALAMAGVFVFVFIFGCFAKERQDEKERLEDPEEMECLHEIDENDDEIRRWFEDLGAEDKARLVSAQFTRQMFTPEQPFVPWWVRKRLGG